MPLQDRTHRSPVDAVPHSQFSHKVAGLVSPDQLLLFGWLQTSLLLSWRWRAASRRHEARQMLSRLAKGAVDQVQEGDRRVRQGSYEVHNFRRTRTPDVARDGFRCEGGEGLSEPDRRLFVFADLDAVGEGLVGESLAVVVGVRNLSTCLRHHLADITEWVPLPAVAD